MAAVNSSISILSCRSRLSIIASTFTGQGTWVEASAQLVLERSVHVRLLFQLPYLLYALPMRSEDVRETLIALGPEQLGDVLLRLSARTDEAAECVRALLSTPNENAQRIRNMLAGLKRRRRFVNRREAGDLAWELGGMLAVLREAVDDPCAGLELVGEFFECDAAVFERCDDSDGAVGDVFRGGAKDLFVEYAAACADKRTVADLVFRLYEKGKTTEFVPTFWRQHTSTSPKRSCGNWLHDSGSGRRARHRGRSTLTAGGWQWSSSPGALPTLVCLRRPG